MNVYTCNSFRGYYPVGAAAAIVAENVSEATKLLNEKLKSMSLDNSVGEEQLNVIDQTKKSVLILVDGNY